MSPDNDVNTIFEKHSVGDIEVILKKMRNDIERKKEDLRIMVGERYRDLIEAADTISDMQNSAKAVSKNIERMEGLCESLQQRGLIGFKTKMTTSSDSSRMLGSGHEYSIAVQVKLLVDVPEILWELTEKKEFLDAAKLLLLAQQAHTALQLSPNAAEILEKFPVISRQWSSISQFRSTISKGCIFVIKNEVKDFERMLNAVAAIMFIEGHDMQASLQKVLELRRASLKSTLVVKPSTVSKTQIVNFVVYFISSFNIVHYIFLGSDGKVSLLEKKICQVSGECEHDKEISEYGDAPISLLQENSLALSFLPKSVVEFRPKLRCNLNTLSTKHIEEEIQHWLRSVITESSKTIAELLRYSTSIKALSLIRNGVWEAQNENIEDEKWSRMVSVMLGQTSFSPWEAVVCNAALDQAKHIIEKELNAITDSIIDMVKAFTSDVYSHSKICMEEGDITDFLWSESMSDLPDQTMWLTMNSRNNFETTEKFGLFYKSRGYTSRLQNICKVLNRKLLSLLDDISHYSSGTSEEKSGIGVHNSYKTENSDQDFNTLLFYLEEQTLLVFKRFVDDVGKIAMDQFLLFEENLAKVRNNSGSPFPFPETTIIVTISRLCQALPLVCHQMKTCASASVLANQSTTKRISLGMMQPDTVSWGELNRYFSEKCTVLMTKFLSVISRLFGEELRRELSMRVESNSPENLLLLFSMWEEVRIEEEGESGKVVESSIAVPSSPSPALIKALMHVCTCVNCVCAHTVPRTSQMQLVTTLCSETHLAYEGSSLNVNQSTALQIIFDLKLIQNILLPRENKELGKRFSSLIQKLESAVDPFDLDVLSPHISSKVKMASQRILALMGTIIPREKQPLTIKSSSSSSANNTLPVVPSVEIPRFSNVPLPPSATSRKISIMPSVTLDAHIKSSLDISSLTPRDTPSAASSRSTASSIFSAMSSSWFGS